MLLSLTSIIALALTGISTRAEIIDVSQIRGDSLIDAYKEMNAQLVRDFPACNTEATMNAVKGILAKEINGREISSLFKSLTGPAKVSQAYKLFGALSQLIEGHRCDANAINILKQNDLATEGRARKYLVTGADCSKRVEGILLHYVRLSYRECPKVHADLMRQTLNNFDDRQFNHVHRLNEGKISKYLKDLRYDQIEGNEALVQLALNTRKIMLNDLTQGRNLYYNLYGVLAQFEPEKKHYLKPIVDDRTGSSKIDGSKIGDLVEEQVMRPCRNYVEAFGTNIFEPEIYLASFNHKPLSDDQEFYLNWINYNICKVYVEFEQQLLSGVKFSASN